VVDQLNGKLLAENKRYNELVAVVKRYEKAGNQMFKRYKDIENALLVENVV
jgi:hypothetical protein